MRTVSTILPTAPSRWKRLLRILTRPNLSLSSLPVRALAHVRSESLSELWFTAAVPVHAATHAQPDAATDPFVNSQGINGGPSTGGDHKAPDERTLKLGQTLRMLSPLLPNLLKTQLPPEIVSPNVSLHLFPSTHPHLPVVKGRIPYRAALMTAPVAWGCVPVVGNVKLIILSERMVRSGFITAPSVEEHCSGLGEEKLVVKWKTEPKRNGNGNNAAAHSSAVENGGINRGLSTLLGGDRPLFGKDAGSDTFSGLFVFSFDSEGRIANHTIEHADEVGGFDQTSKMITLTDWLLGKARWRILNPDNGVPIPGLAYRMRVCRDEVRKHDRWQRRQ